MDHYFRGTSNWLFCLHWRVVREELTVTGIRMTELITNRMNANFKTCSLLFLLVH